MNVLRGVGGGGVHPNFFVKLDSEIVVVQQTRARDPTFEGVQGINKHHKKFQAKIRSGKAATGPRPFFAIPYTGKNHKNGFFGGFLSFFGIGTIFLKYKP